MPLQRAASTTVTAGDLLSAYRPGAAFLSSPSTTLLGQGGLAVLEHAQDVADALGDVITEDGRPAVAMGAIPFDPGSPARLVVPRVLHRAEGTRAREETRHRALPGTWEVKPVPEPREHAEAVRRALDLLTAPDGPDTAPRKIVLARSLRLTGDRPVDVARVLANLARRDPDAHVFAVDLPPRGGGRRTLVGASPELLVAKRGTHVTSNPLAGSAPRSADPTKDQRAGVALLASEKDRYEHAVVVEAVAAALEPYCRTLDVPAEPSLVRTATMWHLSTRVTGELDDPRTTSLDLVHALHPTPAVCGTPTHIARAAIGDIEPFDRGFYTGVVGHVDAAGDGEWAVTIRCADVEDTTLDLFAGGGIVPGSDPKAELAETSAKLRTLLLALGVDRPL
ncbi:isochorismate synthase [Marinactinospora thermotolerans DSM 45154]|uniref:isochorismate synthase n=1 Tax=Marinactinospora thermotolerans DSM 45154 TaxID=1122192 RepID=A0A1T4TGP1_9ACTN|nr:isochorismate synthase [Marinactinospora thermotolerans]SKA39461.1 isochorismate synthase [Marinactinospora thermotolerans DSM 45154]